MEKSKALNKRLLYVFLFVFFSVLYFVFEEPKESIFLILSISTLIIIIKDRDKILSGTPIYYIVLVIVLSYIASTIFILTRGYSMELSISRTPKDVEDKAVLLVYEGESEMFSFEKGITNINNKGTLKEKFCAPYTLWINKKYYQTLGKSNYKMNTVKVKRKLQTLLSDEFKVYLSYLYDTDYVEEVLINIANDGNRDVIIVPVFLTDGQNLKVLKSRVEKMKLYHLNINVKYIEPLWDSEEIADSYDNKISQILEGENSNSIGIVLVGEGQEGYKRNKNLKAVREDSMFRNRIKTRLVDNTGIDENKIKIGWFNYVEPYYEESVKSLLDYSVRRIIILYAKPSVTNIENTIISQKIISKVYIPEGIRVTIIDGFLEDIFFLNELKNRIEFTNLQKWE